MRITNKLVLILALMSTPAVAGNLFVPNQHPTIQAAVDVASPGDRILVAAGEYDGALITKWVKISGEGDQTVITNGPNRQAGSSWFHNAFRIEAGAERTSIRDLRIDLVPLAVPPEFELIQKGIFGQGVDKVEISNVRFIGLNTGIEIRSGDKWRVTDNTVEGLRPRQTRPRRATGFRLFDSSKSFIGFNTVTHNSLAGDGGKVFRGIEIGCLQCLEPSENNKIIQNEVAIDVPSALIVEGIRLIDRAAIYGAPISVFNNKVIENDFDSMRFLPLELIDYNVIE